MKTFSDPTYSGRESKAHQNMRTMLKFCRIFAVLAVALAMQAIPARAEPVIGDYVFGKADAPVTIIEYASMTCSHCADFHNNTFAELKKAYVDTGKVKFIFRDFPFDQVGFQAAVLARCAGEKRFPGFVSVLFKRRKNWSNDKNPTRALQKLGRLGGIGKAQFEACMGNKELTDKILERQLEAKNKYGINSTPSFVINGELHAGDMPFEDFAKIIDDLL